MAWQRRSYKQRPQELDETMTRHQRQRAMLDAQMNRALTAIPRPIQILVMEDAEAVLEEIVASYKQQLGEKHKITRAAGRRLRNVRNRFLGRKGYHGAEELDSPPTLSRATSAFASPLASPIASPYTSPPLSPYTSPPLSPRRTPNLRVWVG